MPITPEGATLEDVAARYNIPLPLARALIHQESGGDPGAVSPAGATGLTQVMPATAAGMYGITPQEASTRLKDPSFALDAGFKYLRQQKDDFGSWKHALAAYNAGPGAVREYHGVPPYEETQNYVKTILGRAGSFKSLPAATGAPVAPQPRAAEPRTPAAPDERLHDFAVSSLERLASGQSLDPLADLAALVHIKTHPLPQSPQTPQSPQGPMAPPGFAPDESRQNAGVRPGKVRVAPNADREGAHLSPEVVHFVSSVAGIYGRPLTIGTGTRHSQYVKGTTRQSAHWTGHAADIPASGAKLTRLGRSALIAAGMSPAEAKKQKGGLFNVNGYQIIFNTTGKGIGNHYDHLHVGVSGGAT